MGLAKVTIIIESNDKKERVEFMSEMTSIELEKNYSNSRLFHIDLSMHGDSIFHNYTSIKIRGNQEIIGQIHNAIKTELTSPQD